MFRRWSKPGPWSNFDDVMRDAFGTTTDPRAFAPDYDVRTDDEAMHVELDVPGLQEADLVVEVQDGVLSVGGSRPYKEGRDGEQVFLGRRYGSFSRQFPIPEDFDGDRLNAQLADGVLTIDIPRRPKNRARKIPVLSGTPTKRLGGGGSK
jgi:HSP20 family protein